MKYLHVNENEIDEMGRDVWMDEVRFHDIVVVDGVIIKNRDGIPGGKIGKAMFTWNERREP